MDAVGAHRERHVDPVVHEEERARPRGRGPELLGDLEELPAGQVLLAELDGGEPGVERRGHDRDELPSLRRVAVGQDRTSVHEVPLRSAAITRGALGGR